MLWPLSKVALDPHKAGRMFVESWNQFVVTVKMSHGLSDYASFEGRSKE